MKRIIIEGEIGEEVKKQLKQIASLSSAINDMAETKYELSQRMWEHIKKEYPDTSENSTVSVIEGKVLLVDRIQD